jgi:hypothetical protein
MGKSVSTPPVPDYKAAAKEQGVQNVEAARTTARLSNPNMITPFGTQTVTYGTPKFDEAAYNKALQEYQTKGGSYATPVKSDFMKAGPKENVWVGGGDSGGYWEERGGSTFDKKAYEEALAKVGKAPTKEMFTTIENADTPLITQKLTPEAQATLEAQQRVQRALSGLGEQGIATASSVLAKPFNPNLPAIQTEFGEYDRARANTQADTYGLAQREVTADKYGLARGEVPLQYSIDTSNLAAMPINAGTTAQNLILQRLNPTIEAGDVSFRQQLANQGLVPGTEAYDKAFRNREMSKNDLYNQAALQGINLDMAARQQGLNEQLGLGTFANQAQLAGAGLYNQAVGQNFGQGVTANEILNRSIAQNFGQGVTADQLYNQAAAQNFNQQLQAAQFENMAQQQAMQQALGLRNQPINEIAALMSGSQIQLPQFSGYQPTQVQAAPLFNATQAQYQGQLGAANAQNAANSQLTQGLFQLGGAALLAPTGTFSGAAGLFSDRRLKTNIKQVGVADNGLNIYSYNYVWGGPTQLGYMADEVEKIVPEAVGEFNGYKTVNYGMI